MTRHGAALLALSIVASAGWAYTVNYDTRAVLDRLSGLRAEIAAQREALQVLRVEWAYLNAPDRLAELVAAHNDVLALVPLVPEGLGQVAAIPYPPRAPGAAPLAPAMPEALIAAAPSAPATPAPAAPAPGAPAQPAVATAHAGASSAAAGAPETMTLAMRDERLQASRSAKDAVPQTLEAAIAAALVEVGVRLDETRSGVPHDGVVAVPSEGVSGVFAAAAPGVPLPATRPATRPVAWARQ